ncbi:MAG: hypothetical protein JEY99_06580 [Spirochaetales bacterium]|nr:hypothetical protein [Spirochaetales bacterium]
MKVKLYAPPFCDHSGIDDHGFLELKAGARLKDLYSIIKVPLLVRPVLITSVNYEKSGLLCKLEDGDTVSIFWPLSGG